MATAGGSSSSGASVGNDAVDLDPPQQALDVEEKLVLAMVAGVFLGWSGMVRVEPHLIDFGERSAAGNSRFIRTTPVEDRIVSDTVFDRILQFKGADSVGFFRAISAGMTSAVTQEPQRDGVGVVALTSQTIDGWLTDHDVTFIAFVTPWCQWSQRLLPALHATADVMESHAAAGGVSIGTVDCVEEKQLCSGRFRVKAFPTMKVFLGDELQTPDYTGDRTVTALFSYLSDMAHRTPRNDHERQERGKMTGDDKASFEHDSRTRSHLVDSNNGGVAAMETFETGEEDPLKGVARYHRHSVEVPMHWTDEQVEEVPTMKAPHEGLEKPKSTTGMTAFTRLVRSKFVLHLFPEESDVVGYCFEKLLDLEWGKMTGDDKSSFEHDSRTRSHLEDSNNGGVAAMETFETGEEDPLKGIAKFHEHSVEVPMHGADKQVQEVPNMKVLHGDLEEPHRDGLGVMELTSQTFDGWLTDHDVTLVVFYAPWCIWCQRLLPTLYETADAMESHAASRGVSIATVNCVEEKHLCARFKIVAFPTLNVFLGHEMQTPEYTCDRTTTALSSYLLDMANRKPWPSTGMTSFKRLVRPGLVDMLFPEGSDMVDYCSETLLDRRWNTMTDSEKDFSKDALLEDGHIGRSDVQRFTSTSARYAHSIVGMNDRLNRVGKLPDSWVAYPTHGPNEAISSDHSPVPHVREGPCGNLKSSTGENEIDVEEAFLDDDDYDLEGVKL